MNQDLLAHAKQRLSLSALMAQLGFGDRAKKSARCPFHEDSSASFSLYVGDDGELHGKPRDDGPLWGRRWASAHPMKVQGRKGAQGT